MKHFRNLLSIVMIAMTGICLVSCSDDDGPGSSSGDYDVKPSKVSKPTISEVASATTSTDFDATFKIKSEEDPSSVIFHYVTYSKRQASVSASDCKKSSSCGFQQVVGKSTKYWYYRARHTGFREGHYIYYYVEARNSAGSAKTIVKSRVFKRT